MQLEATPAEPTAKKTCTPARWSDEIALPVGKGRGAVVSTCMHARPLERRDRLACFRSRRNQTQSDAIRRNLSPASDPDAIRRNQTQSLACFRSRRDLELERLLHRDRA